MASTPSASLRLELMATGDQSGTWGDTTNTNLGTLLEEAITGVLSIAQGDVANLTLTTTNYASDQARNAVIDVTGALTAQRNVVVQTAEKLYLIKNSTTGGFSIVAKTSGGTGVTIANGTSQWVYSDGTNVVQGLTGTLATQAASAVAITGGTITGLTSLTLASGAARPATNDAAALGSASLSWSDLFLASGSLINIANGNWIATHSSGILTVSTGDLRVTTAGTNTASVVTVGGTQTLTAKTLTSPTLTTPALGTPASGVMTNVTGTATGLTAGITNALKSATTTVDVSAATAPTSGQVLTATAGTTATWQTPSATGGITSLGTITTTSGSSQALSGLDLTTYKFLLCVFNGVSTNSATGTLAQNSVTIQTMSASATQTMKGGLQIDLSTGFGWSATTAGVANAQTGTNVAAWDTGVTTASTAITFTSSATFDAGSITVYGMK